MNKDLMTLPIVEEAEKLKKRNAELVDEVQKLKERNEKLEKETDERELELDGFTLIEIYFKLFFKM